MTTAQLYQNIKQKSSFLCVGLDTDLNKIPKHLLQESDPIFAFNKAIIDATAPYCVAYKPNLAFYEVYGVAGWQALQKTVTYIRTHYPDQFIIADAKRGDIGNTSDMYAKAFFESMDFDAVTLAPYMGKDTVAPFLNYPGKFAVLLALTSNASSADFQTVSLADGQEVYQRVIEVSKTWGNEQNTMYVVGATKAESLAEIRKQIPNHFLLIPGVGAQGGSLEEVVKYGMNETCGLLVNSSRAIIYADSTVDFAAIATREAAKVAQEMALYLA